MLSRFKYKLPGVCKSIKLFLCVIFCLFVQAQGKRLGVVGWVQNTPQGTVQGQIQGPGVQVRKLQQWLQTTGSPKSRIDKAEFHNEKKIARLEHSDFCILK